MTTRKRSKESIEEREDEIKSEVRAYFSIIPHVVDDLPLSVFAYRLYGHIVRRAGEHGVCFESVRNMAEHCMVSIGTIVRAKKELDKAGLIRIKSVQGQNGRFSHDEITLVDIMPSNVEFYSNRTPEERSQMIEYWKEISKEQP